MIPVEGSRQLHEAIDGSLPVAVPGEGHTDWFADLAGLVKLTREFLDA